MSEKAGPLPVWLLFLPTVPPVPSHAYSTGVQDQAPDWWLMDLSSSWVSLDPSAPSLWGLLSALPKHKSVCVLSCGGLLQGSHCFCVKTELLRLMFWGLHSLVSPHQFQLCLSLSLKRTCVLTCSSLSFSLRLFTVVIMVMMFCDDDDDGNSDDDSGNDRDGGGVAMI